MTVKKVHLKIRRYVNIFNYYRIVQKKYFLGLIPYWSVISGWFYDLESAHNWMSKYPESFNKEREEQYKLYNRVVEIVENKPKDLNGALSLSSDSLSEKPPRPKPPPPPKPEPSRFQKG